VAPIRGNKEIISVAIYLPGGTPQHRLSGPLKIVAKYSSIRYAIEEEGQIKQFHALNLKPGGRVNRLTADIL